MNEVIGKFSKQRDHMLSLNQNESRALFNENQQLKERIRLLEVQRDPMEMSRDNIRN